MGDSRAFFFADKGPSRFCLECGQAAWTGRCLDAVKHQESTLSREGEVEGPRVFLGEPYTVLFLFHHPSHFLLPVPSAEARAVRGIAEALARQGYTEAPALTGTAEALTITGIAEARALRGTAEARALRGIAETRIIRGIAETRTLRGTAEAPAVRCFAEALANRYFVASGQCIPSRNNGIQLSSR